MARLVGALTVTLILLAAFGSGSVPQTQGASSFLASFDGRSPAGPQSAYHDPSFAIDLQNRNSLEMTPTTGQHGADCNPTGSHPVTADEDHVYYCKNHLMTAVGDAGYSVIYMTANNLVDFSSGATISWRQDFMRGSSRSWTDLWIQPVADNLALPLEDWQTTDLQGAPRNAVHIRQNTSRAGTVFGATVYRDFKPEDTHSKWWLGLEKTTGYTPSSMRRDLVQVDLSSTHIKVSMPEYGIVWVDQDIPELPFRQALVEWGHHEYTPQKGCKSILGGPCAADTVHWDDFSISPSIPFQIIHSDKRSGTVFNFDSPAPADSYLRFSAHGDPTLSFGGGPTEPAHKQESSTPHDGHAASFWQPVPTGARSVAINGDRVKDVYVFAVYAGPGPSPTPTPTATALPTSFFTPTPTVTPSPVPTVFPTPSISGDFNCDGGVTGKDALAEMRYLAGVNPQVSNCVVIGSLHPSVVGDVNCDNKITVADVLVILRYAAGNGSPPSSCAAAAQLSASLYSCHNPQSG